MGLVILSVVFSMCCLFGIFFIIGRRLSVLSSIDVESIPAEREARVKNKIIEDRIQRKLGEFQRTAAFAIVPLQGLLAHGVGYVRRLYHWLLELREHHEKGKIVGGSTISSIKEDMDPLRVALEEANRCIQEEEYESAEKKYIEIISKEKKFVEAYQGLADLYVKQKEWEQAQEVLLHVCKLQKTLLKSRIGNEEGSIAILYAQTLFKLNEVYQILGEYEKAYDSLKKALEFQKNNPKYLNALVELSVLLKQRIRAEKALEQLRKANPDNQKLNEFEDRIAQMPY